MQTLFKILTEPSAARTAGNTVVRTLHLGMLNSYKPQGKETTRNALVAEAFGDAAQMELHAGDLVAAGIEFSTTLYNGRYINNVSINSIHNILKS